MASISYILHLITLARFEVSFNYIFAKLLEILAVISMLCFAIFLFRYIALTLYFNMITTEANKL